MIVLSIFVIDDTTCGHQQIRESVVNGSWLLGQRLLRRATVNFAHLNNFTGREFTHYTLGMLSENSWFTSVYDNVVCADPRFTTPFHIEYAGKKVMVGMVLYGMHKLGIRTC